MGLKEQPLILTRSQKTHCKQCGVREEQYLQMLYDRIEERKIKRDTTRLESQKCNYIEAENPVLIIGGGPSTDRYLEDVKNFKGTILAFEIGFRKLVDIGVIPDYIMTLEKAVRGKHIPSEQLQKCAGKTKIICSSITIEDLICYLRNEGMPPTKYITQQEPRLSNVGLWSIYYAKEVLKADKICLLGFEHEGTGYEQLIYDEWVADFWHFVEKWPKNLIVNCSDGGVLYSNLILDSTLKDLKIGNTSKQ